MFFVYYAILLSAAGVFTLLASLPFPWVTQKNIPSIPFLFLIVQYVVNAIAFYIDYRAVRMMNIKENIHFMRNFLHWYVRYLLLFFSYFDT